MRGVLGGVATAVALLTCVGCEQVQGLDKYQKGPCVDCEAGNCTHLFCADFDEAPDFNAGWSSFAQSPGTSLQLDKQIFVSPPASLLASTPGGSASVAYLTKSFAVAAASAQLQFDVRLGPTDVTDAGGSWTIDIARVSPAATMGQGGAAGSVALVWTASGVTLAVESVAEAGGMSKSKPLSPAPILGGWSHVELDVAFGMAGDGSAKALVDGMPSAELDAITTSTGSASSVTLTLGVNTAGQAPTFLVNTDNVTFDATM